MKLYKLTDRKGWLYQVDDYLTRTAPGYKRAEYHEGDTVSCASPNAAPALCSKSVVHAYRSLAQAFLFDLHHTCRWGKGKLYEAEGDIVREDDTKVGCRFVQLVKRIPFPRVKRWDMYALYNELGLPTYYVINSRTGNFRNGAMVAMRDQLSDAIEWTDELEGIDWDDWDWILGFTKDHPRMLNKEVEVAA